MTKVVSKNSGVNSDVDKPGKILALCGGVGGAKLALGLNHILAPGQLTVVVNTGDDFDHLGLRICPDIDTVTYTLANIVNTETGWGRADETDSFMSSYSALGGEDWFFLGDRDLALHIERTRRLNAGESLGDITRVVATKLGINASIVPMSNDRVATMVETESEALAFQHYFVRERCRPSVTGFHFDGVEQAQPHSEFMKLLASDELTGVIICPSNPFVSIDPILALPAVRQALRTASAPVIAISPIVGGAAIKGPTAKMMAELGMVCSPGAVANHYRDILSGFILDQRDSTGLAEVNKYVQHVSVAQTLMLNLPDKLALAHHAIDFVMACQQDSSKVV